MPDDMQKGFLQLMNRWLIKETSFYVYFKRYVSCLTTYILSLFVLAVGNIVKFITQPKGNRTYNTRRPACLGWTWRVGEGDQKAVGGGGGCDLIVSSHDVIYNAVQSV